MSPRRVLPLIFLLASFLPARSADSDSLARNPAYNAIQPRFQPLAALLSRSLTDQPAFGRELSFYHTAEEKFARMREDILGARSSIHMVYYRYTDKEFGTAVRNLLAQKAAEGVEVKFIFENLADFWIPSSFFQPLRDAGAEVEYFTPLSRPWRFLRHVNHRDHQKFVIIDGNIGYTGGMNISDKYLNLWQDTHLRVEGRAAAVMDGPFQDVWKDLDRGFQPSVSLPSHDPSGVILQTIADRAPDKDYPVEEAFIWALDNSRDSFYAITPYFAPTKPLLEALLRAARNGKDVRLILPAKSDIYLMGACHWLYYRRCKDAGVRIFLNPGPFNHSKVFVADDYLSSVGSANLDGRSLHLNYENNTFIYDSETAASLKGYLEGIMDASSEVVSPGPIPMKGLSRKLIMGFTWLIAPLM